MSLKNEVKENWNNEEKTIQKWSLVKEWVKQLKLRERMSITNLDWKNKIMKKEKVKRIEKQRVKKMRICLKKKGRLASKSEMKKERVYRMKKK